MVELLLFGKTTVSSLVYRKFYPDVTEQAAKVSIRADQYTHVPTICELSNGSIVVAGVNYNNGRYQSEVSSLVRTIRY